MTKSKVFLFSLILFLLLILMFFIALSFGTETIPLLETLKIFSGVSIDSLHYDILMKIRLPRVLTAILAGASLAVVGTVFQALLRNPLSEPYILGVSSGGALGAIIAIAVNIQFPGISVFAFAGSLLAFFLVYLFARRYGEIDPTSLLLVGVMINSFFSALILLIITFIDQSFRTALFWLMGNLTQTDFPAVVVMFVFFLITTIPFLFMANHLNLISISEENAKQYGVNTEFLKKFSFISGSLLVGIIVSYVGIIGFVGLVVPHICRLIFGYDNRIILPTSIFIGSIFMIISDLLSRVIFTPIEIPIGSITAIIGSPIFIFLLRKKYQFNGG